MDITGEVLIGNEDRRTGQAFEARDAVSGARLSPAFCEAGAREVDDAARLAMNAFESYRAMDLAARARFLERIAVEIEELGEPLMLRTVAETGLPRARLEGERSRTANQLRLFAEVVRRGDWLDLRVDPARPDRVPQPRADLRQRRVPLGPVAVFGASNFPLAFSTAGGDTASALAAGCPVIVKGHPAHPGAGELVARAVRRAAQACGLHEGVFSYLPGAHHGLGTALVQHPFIAAVGFTGSRGGGLYLARLAADRPRPIPVYAEMSSVNPVFLLPAALEARPELIAEQFVASLTLGVGQFCTNPGLVFAVESPGLRRFVARASVVMAEVTGGHMLTPAMREAYEQGLDRAKRRAGVTPVAQGRGEALQARPELLSITAEAFLSDAGLAEENFGPSGLLVVCDTPRQMLAAIERLEGQLTATLHLEDSDLEFARVLVPRLELICGRLLANGWPTGVEVGHAMVHGGPFPATSDGRSTSVGSAAIERFLRPICYQDLPQSLLPHVLQDEMLQGLPRRVDGRMHQPEGLA